MDFLIIAVTRPDFFPEEGKMITEILRNDNARYVHIRKPGAAKEEIETLIREIPEDLHPRIKLHDCFELSEKYNLGGCHLNSRNLVPGKKINSLSKSFHSLREIEEASGLDYFFISPVFNSISKPGYNAAFDMEELSKIVKGKNAIALGGVSPEKIPLLKQLGFRGAAMLSYFFPLKE